MTHPVSTEQLSRTRLRACLPSIQFRTDHDRRRQVKCWSSSGRQRRNARKPGLFEVQVITPPKESLGIHAFPPNTHNGDRIEVNGKDFIVSSLSLRYKLVKGKYEKEHNRLDVQEMSRYFYNMHLDRLMEGPGKPGKL